MEEDIEIEELLKSNEEILIEAAQTSRDENSMEIKYEQHVSNYNYWSPNQIESLKNKSLEMGDSEDTLLIQQQSSMTTTTKDTNEEDRHDDDIQELLDDQIVLYMSKGPTKHVLQLYSMSSDEENESSECDSDEKDEFINEIAGNNELYGGVFMEHVNKVVKSKSKQVKNSAVNDLLALHKLVVERDPILKNLQFKLQERLYEIEEAMEQTRESLSLLSVPDNENIKIPNLYRYFFRKFGRPYFKDNCGFSSLTNVDHAAKLQNGQTKLMYLEKPWYWIMPYQEMLLNAVKQTLVTENTDKLIKQINKIKVKIKECPSKKNCKELVKKLVNCQEELSNLASKSAEALISAESPDRDYDWMKYSLSLFNGEQSHDDCRRFWHVYLKPSINKSKWSSAEDLKLTEIAEKLNFQDWNSIAKKLGTNRSEYQCLVHFQTRLNSYHEFSRGRWTKEEDEKLLALINTSKIGDFISWTKVSYHMGDRSHIQIYNRFRNSLNPKLIKGRFTRGEDLLIVAGIEVYGCSYNELSSLMNNRSCSQIRERYERYLLPKNSRIGSFTLEEDEKLLRLVEKHGDKNWTAISNEMKTRSRTQVRQRFRNIQRIMKSKPGWTVTDVKRKNIQLIDKNIGLTEKNVRLIKQEIDEVEQAFNLTKVEKETFRIEKLKELKDKILLRKYNVKAKRKRVYTDGLSVKNMLIEYFKQNQIKSTKCTTIGDHDDYKSYLTELLLLAKYFGHDLQIPEDENEIKNNPRLSNCLKKLLLKSKTTTTGDFMQSKKGPHSIPNDTLEPNIDYIPPQTDSSIIMNEWWFNPPFDITHLNFSEIFKQTIYDYSYGMHEDIWLSKMKRSPQINFSDDLYESSLDQSQLYNMPPNYLTCLGLKSILLSRPRLRHESKKKTTEQFREKPEDITVTRQFDINKLLHQFQETMVTLFNWPKTLSLNSISSNPLIKSSSEKIAYQRQRMLNLKCDKLKNPTQDPCLQDIKTIERKKNAKDQQTKVMRSILEQHQDLKRQGLDIKRGIQCKRKMKIEHLVKEVGKNKNCINQITKKLKPDEIYLSDINFNKSAKSKTKFKSLKVDRITNSNCTHEKTDEPSSSGRPSIRSSAKTNASLNKLKRDLNSKNLPSKKICNSSTQ